MDILNKVIERSRQIQEVIPMLDEKAMEVAAQIVLIEALESLLPPRVEVGDTRVVVIDGLFNNTSSKGDTIKRES